MNPRTVLRTERGAFDLPSIITGVVVVAILTAGVLATIFGIIPFAQDNASKQDVSSVRTAEAVAKVKDGRFMDTAGLTAAGYLSGNAVTASGLAPGDGTSFMRMAETGKLRAAAGVPADASCFLAVAKSGSGAIFYGSDVSAEARRLNSTDDPGCLTKSELRALIDSIGGFDGGYAPQSPVVTGSVSDRTTAVFTWPAVEDATGYRVEARINGGDWVLKSENQTDTRVAVTAGESETVEARVAARNDSGDSEFATASVKLADPIVTNGGFENGLASWTSTGTASADGTARTGAGSVLIGPGTGANTSLVKQTVTIPDNMYSTLTYSYDVDSSGGTAYDSADTFAVRLYNGATVVATVQSGPAAAGTWITKTFDVTAQRGKTLDLQFSVYNNGTGNAASVRFDDIAITTSPATPPATPAVGASAADGGATLTWAAPASPATAITSYTVTPYKDGVAQTPIKITGNPPATRTVVTGLTNGSSYEFTLTATNAAGTSPESAKSVTVVPGPVNIVNAGFENGLEGWTVTGWQATAASNTHTGVGSLKLTNTQTVANTADVSQQVVVPDNAVTSLNLWYNVPTLGANSGSVRVQITDPAGGVATKLTASTTSGWIQAPTIDLTSYRGKTVGIHLVGHDFGGLGAYAAYFDDVSVTSTPSTSPKAPTGISTSAGDTTATLKWTAAVSPGSTVTGYTVTPYLNNVALAPVQTTATKVTIPDLSNGSNYTFTVNATNKVGTSAESAQSAVVTPTQTTLANGDFESALTSWATSGTRPPSSSATFHAGARSAALGGQNGTNGTMSQSFTVPASGTTSVSFWYKSSSSQSSCTYALFEAKVIDGLGTTATTPVSKCVSSVNNSDPWKQVTVDLSAYKGQRMSLQFAMNVSSLSSSPGTVYVDDVVVSTQ